MAKYIEKHTKEEIMVHLAELRNFWVGVKLQHDVNQTLDNKTAMKYLGELKDIWIQKIVPFKDSEDFQAKELYEKSKRIYTKMIVFLEKYIDPVTVDEVEQMNTSLKIIIDNLLQNRKKDAIESNESKMELKQYLKFIIDRLAVAAKAKNETINFKIKELDKKLNLILTNNHLYG